MPSSRPDRRACPCSYCATRLEASTSVTAPAPGDFAVCWACGGINIFDESLALRRARLADRRARPTTYAAAREVARRVKGTRVSEILGEAG